MNNIDNDVIQSLRITNMFINPYYSKYCAIHAFSNENLKVVTDLINFKNKKVLLTGSSADQYLMSVYKGSKEEVIYDINKLAKYYIYLKIGAVKALNYDEFINFIIPNMKGYLNIDTYKKIIDYIPKDITEFWNKYFNEAIRSRIKNFIFYPEKGINLDNLKNGISIYKKEDYEILKKIIENREYPKFINTDIAFIEDFLKNDDIFDIIYLSNIIDSQIDEDYNDGCSICSEESWIYFIEKVLGKYLSKDGEMLIDYKVYLRDKISNLPLFNNSKFNAYEIDSNNYNGKSAILTYKPKRK